MNKYKEYIQEYLSEQEVLEQLAEECSELAQASLKLIRTRSNNTTPISRDEALLNFYEEVYDVMAVMSVYGVKIVNIAKYANKKYAKYERWARRLGYKEQDQEVEE